MIKSLPRFKISYVSLPYKRNQDFIKIFPGKGDIKFMASVVDGWNPSTGSGQVKIDSPGRKAAELGAKDFPKIFLETQGTSLKARAEKAALLFDKQLVKLYPQYVSCVASFLCHSKTVDYVISVGDVVTLLWNGKIWYKPKEIHDYQLNPKKYPSNVSRFFGRGELKGKPPYSAQPDVAIFPSGIPVLIATDGVKDVLSIKDINEIVGNPVGRSPKRIAEKLLLEIQKRKSQKDDISILFRIS